MVATGLCFLAGPLFEQFDAPVMQTLSLLLSDIWLVLLVVLLLSFPSGRPLRSATDRALVGVLVFSSAVLGPLWLLFLDYPGNLLAAFADADTAHAIEHPSPARARLLCLGRDVRRARAALVGGDAAAAAGDAPEPRRRRQPAAARRAAGERHRDRHPDRTRC